jgi:hypothetical protein
VFTPHGDPVVQDVYSAEGSLIELKRAEGGTLAVEGGQRVMSNEEGESREAAPAPEMTDPDQEVSK